MYKKIPELKKIKLLLQRANLNSIYPTLFFIAIETADQ